MSRIVKLAKLPKCDICGSREAVCDAKTNLGPFAYLCQECRPRYSVGGHLHLGEHPLETPIVLAEPEPERDPLEPIMTIGAVLKDKARRRAAQNPPSIEELERMALDGECYAVDGCPCDPDGACEHGSPSWLRQLGLI